MSFLSRPAELALTRTISTRLSPGFSVVTVSVKVRRRGDGGRRKDKACLPLRALVVSSRSAVALVGGE
jgi:hypothetical protein